MITIILKATLHLSVYLRCYNRQPTDTAGYGPSCDYSEVLQKDSVTIKLKSTLT